MKIIGHRGARGLAPENTIASLRAGIAHGADGLEFDVHITRDGVPVLIHDNVLTRADGTEMVVIDHTYDELRAVYPALCTLMAALRFINKRSQAYIEVKSGTDPQAILTDVRRLLVEGWKAEDFCFLSFDFAILCTMHVALPEIPIMVNEMWSSIRAVWRAKKLGTTKIDLYHIWLWPGVIRGLSRRGYQLHCFTLNDVGRARRWQRHGLYAVVTDFPDQMRQLASEVNH